MRGISKTIILSVTVSLSLISVSIIPNSFAEFEFTGDSSPASISFGECKLPPPDFPNIIGMLIA